MPITTCTSCEKAYDAWSEESANEPGRLCPECYGGEARDAALGLHDMAKDLDKENAALRAHLDAMGASLRIYFHAHETGNSVPPYLVEQARAVLRAYREG
jgi:hypothetical protein